MSLPEDRPVSHRSKPRRRLRRRIILGVSSGLAVLLIVTAGFAIATYQEVSSGIHRSTFSLPSASAKPGVAQNTGETNILVMGLDSRVDQNGKALPEVLYNALRAGDQSDGGYNANVLMLIHIPANGGKAVGISIPRDDYAELAGTPDGVSKSKIKEAYGLALDEKLRELKNAGGMSDEDAYQAARAAGRQTQIATVSQFLGGVPINHFIEITMAAFYTVAQAVQPVTVCLNHPTQDRYSGADFAAGRHELTAEQAMSFVRQRRDTGPTDLELTDFDRTRRQQAFMVSLAYKLKQADTFTNFGTMRSLIDTAKQYIALDQDFELLSFAQQAARLAGGNISFTTLPIDRFERIDGKDVNVVDLDAVRATVKRLLEPPAPTTDPPSAPASPAPPGTPASPATPPATGAPNVYHDWKTPLESGAIPCVN
ncbi:LCP family protein [Leifsonia poae]|uniref:LCP family protein n=1 Tax=Leifsonia poae TaxID=110933 RepID=UPI001CBABE64|nr:LCP family protein [Leifsonia poae]